MVQPDNPLALRGREPTAVAPWVLVVVHSSYLFEPVMVVVSAVQALEASLPLRFPTSKGLIARVLIRTVLLSLR